MGCCINDTNACCHLRKTRPLQNALDGYEAWITGRKRFQAATRAEMPVFENEGGKRLKVNPLATWDSTDISAYIDAHDLPRHPLVARGYPSVGCAPCTHPVAPGQDPRSGRWAGQDKVECGIRFENGKFVRGTEPEGSHVQPRHQRTPEHGRYCDEQKFCNRRLRAFCAAAATTPRPPRWIWL